MATGIPRPCRSSACSTPPPPPTSDRIKASERAIISKIPGGQNYLKGLDDPLKGKSLKYEATLSEAKAAIAAITRGDTVVFISRMVFRANEALPSTQFDVMTISKSGETAIIEVKTSAAYLNADRILKGDLAQFTKFARFKKGTLKLYDEDGNLINPPTHFYYQFPFPVPQKLVEWLWEKGEFEVIIGLLLRVIAMGSNMEVLSILRQPILALNGIERVHNILLTEGGQIDVGGVLFLWNNSEKTQDAVEVEITDKETALNRLSKWPNLGSLEYKFANCFVQVFFWSFGHSLLEGFQLSIEEFRFRKHPEINIWFKHVANILHNDFQSKRTILGWEITSIGFSWEEELARVRSGVFLEHKNLELDLRN